MQINQFIEYISTERRFSPHTVLAYKTDLLSFRSYLSSTYEITKPDELTSTMLRSYVVEQMEAGLNPKSVNRKISSIKAYIRFMRKTGQMQTNPAAALKAIKTPKVLVSTLSETDINELLNNEFFDDSVSGTRAKAIIELLYATGIRRSELIGLKLSSVDFSQKTIRVLGKRNKERIVPVTETALSAIEAYLAQRQSNASETNLFLTDKGKKLYPELVYTTVKRYLSLVSSLQKKSPHVLRHTFATHLLNKGADMNDIKELMGHANLSATQVYTHNSFEKLKSVYNQSHPREAQSDSL